MLQEKGAWLFFKELCVYSGEAAEGPKGAGLSRSGNSPKLKQLRKAPDRHHIDECVSS